MVHILIVAHAFPPTFGGVETHLWDLSQELSHRGYRIHCLVGGGPSFEQFGRVTVARHPYLSVGYLVSQRRGLPLAALNDSLLDSLAGIVIETMRHFSPDLVHLHNAHHFAPELALAFFNNQENVPLLNSVHDRVGEHVYPDVLGYSWAHTIFASHYLLRSLPSPTGPKTVLWLGIDLNLFSAGGELDERFLKLERPIIFHPARLLRWKGVEVGLEAFVALRKHLGKGTLVLCDSTNIVDDQGEVNGLRHELEKKAKEAGIEERIHFLAFDRSRIAAAYRASDLVWYPTVDEEPLGLVPLEAMATAVPLIVSNSGGMTETVIPDVTGIVVPKNDPGSLANAAKMLLTNRSLRTEMVEAGKRRAQSFEVRTYTTSLEAIYHQSLGRLA